MNLQIQNLVVPRGAHRVVDGVSIEVRAGEAVWLQGANGSGKSTLLLAVAGRLPSSGGIRADGWDARTADAWEREERLPMLTQEPELQVEGMAIDNLVDTLVLGPSGWRWALVSARSARERAWAEVAEVAGQLGMARAELWRPTSELSVGQRRLCGLLRVFRRRPGGRVLLLDEPLAGLRGDRVQEVLSLIEARLEEGWSALISEHVPAIGGLRGVRVFPMVAR